MGTRVPPLRKSLPWLWLFPASLLLTLINWLRLPTAAKQTAWAEDGGVFLRDILEDGVWGSVLKPYDGYLHIIPRLLVSVAHKITPIDFFALSVSFVSCAAVAVVCLAAFFLAKPVIEDGWLRAMLAAIPVLLPVAPVEVLGNAANLHWYLLWLSPWLLVRKPVTNAGRIGLFLGALLTAASEVITGLFVPLALWMIWKQKNFWAPLGLIVGVGLQMLTALNSPRPASLRIDNSVDLYSVVVGFFVQPVAALWRTDSRTLVANLVDFGGLAVLLPAAVLILLFITILWVGRWIWKAAAIYAVGAALACWAASVLINAHPMFNYSQFSSQDWLQSFQYSRYAAAPGMFLLVLVPLAFASFAHRLQPERRTRLMAPASLAAFGLVVLTNFFPATTLRDVGPEWSPGVDIARAACVSDPRLVHTPVTVAPAAWKYARVQVPCSLLLSPAGGPAATEAGMDGQPRLPLGSHKLGAAEH
jgi:hypothetical protein